MTSSPSLIEIELGALPSLQLADVRLQPSVLASTTEYVPTSSCPVVRCWPSLRLKSKPFPFGRVNVKLKLVGSPAGSVFFWTMIFAAPGVVAWPPVTPRNSPATAAVTATKIARRRKNARCRIEMSPFAYKGRTRSPLWCVGVRSRRFTRRTLSPSGGIRNHSNGEMTPPKRSVRSVRGKQHQGDGGPPLRTPRRSVRRRAEGAERPPLSCLRVQRSRGMKQSWNFPEGAEIADGRRVLEALGGGGRYEVFLVFDDEIGG